MNKKRYLECGAVILVLLFCEWFFFRNAIGTGKLLGDDGDGRLTMLITEHWFHVFRGEHRIADLGMFYPAENTLGYSDILLVFGLIHSCFRALGKDMFFAYKATLMLVHVVGSFSLFYLLRYRLKTSSIWAVFGTMAFSYSNTYAIYIGHTQLVAISLVPIVLIFFSLLIEHKDNKVKRNIFAVLSVTAIVLIAYTAWYIAFFTALFVSIYLIVFLVYSLRNDMSVLKAVATFVKLHWCELLLWAAYGIILMIPFVLLEMPILKMSGGRSWDAIAFMPELIDIIGVSYDNLLLGKLMERFNLSSRGYAETEMGLGIVVFILFVVTNIIFKRDKDSDGSYNRFLFRTLSVTIILSLMISVRLSSNRVSLWWFVWRFFPGGSSIRAMSRYLFYLSLPVAIATSLGCSMFFKKRFKYPSIICTICVIMVFISNIKVGGVFAYWDSSDERDAMKGIADPPQDCKGFYIVNDSEKPAVFAQLDAYQIADKYGIYTLNGYSGLTPNGWDRILIIDGDEYLEGVSAWIDENDLYGVYAYDYGNNSWQIHNSESD